MTWQGEVQPRLSSPNWSLLLMIIRNKIPTQKRSKAILLELSILCCIQETYCMLMPKNGQPWQGPSCNHSDWCKSKLWHGMQISQWPRSSFGVKSTDWSEIANVLDGLTEASWLCSILVIITFVRDTSPTQKQNKTKQCNDIGIVIPELHFRDLLYDHAQRWPASAWMFMGSFKLTWEQTLTWHAYLSMVKDELCCKAEDDKLHGELGNQSRYKC